MGQARGREASRIDAHIGRKLRMLRLERGLTLRDLADAMGHSSTQAVSKYEHGSAFPAALMFVTAETLGVPVSAFFEGLSGPGPGLAEEPAAFAAEAPSDTPQSRKIAALLRATPADRHALILKVVRVLAAEAPAEGG